MNIAGRSERAVEERILSALVRAGFAELEKREMRAADTWLCENESLARESFEGNREKQEKRIGRVVSRQVLGQGFAAAAPIIGKAVACALLVFYLGLTVAVATVEQVRVSVYEFLVGIQKEYTELGIDGTSIYAPPEWDGSCYLNYVPFGLDLIGVDKKAITTDGEVIYRNEDGSRWLVFSEYTDAFSVNVNTEDAVINWQEINGELCMFVERKTEKFAVWSMEGSFFVVWTDGACDVISDIVRNVKLINNN